MRSVLHLGGALGGDAAVTDGARLSPDPLLGPRPHGLGSCLALSPPWGGIRAHSGPSQPLTRRSKDGRRCSVPRHVEPAHGEGDTGASRGPQGPHPQPGSGAGRRPSLPAGHEVPACGMDRHTEDRHRHRAGVRACTPHAPGRPLTRLHFLHVLPRLLGRTTSIFPRSVEHGHGHGHATDQGPFAARSARSVPSARPSRAPTAGMRPSVRLWAAVLLGLSGWGQDTGVVLLVPSREPELRPSSESARRDVSFSPRDSVTSAGPGTTVCSPCPCGLRTPLGEARGEGGLLHTRP